MTQTIDIDSMVAGPEMNVLVAEKVMGWKYIDDLHWKCDGEFVKDGRPFNPSTDIADAWLALEKMFCPRDIEKSIIFEVLLCKSHFHMLNAELAATEICKAALKAVM